MSQTVPNPLSRDFPARIADQRLEFLTEAAVIFRPGVIRLVLRAQIGRAQADHIGAGLRHEDPAPHRQFLRKRLPRGIQRASIQLHLMLERGIGVGSHPDRRMRGGNCVHGGCR
jgi:hypothetical protein